MNDVFYNVFFLVGAMAAGRSEESGTGAGSRAAADVWRSCVYRGAAGGTYSSAQPPLQLHVTGTDQVCRVVSDLLQVIAATGQGFLADFSHIILFQGCVFSRDKAVFLRNSQ